MNYCEGKIFNNSYFCKNLAGYRCGDENLRIFNIEYFERIFKLTASCALLS